MDAVMSAFPCPRKEGTVTDQDRCLSKVPILQGVRGIPNHKLEDPGRGIRKEQPESQYKGMVTSTFPVLVPTWISMTLTQFPSWRMDLHGSQRRAAVDHQTELKQSPARASAGWTPVLCEGTTQFRLVTVRSLLWK